MNIFAILKSTGDVSATSMVRPIYEAICNEYGELDFSAIKELSEDKSLVKADIYIMFQEVFGKLPPARFNVIDTPVDDLSKTYFLTQFYQPAKYLNAKLWVYAVYVEMGQYLPRAKIFEYIMSTAKPKIAAPTPEPLIG